MRHEYKLEDTGFSWKLFYNNELIVEYTKEPSKAEINKDLDNHISPELGNEVTFGNILVRTPNGTTFNSRK